MKKVKLEDGTTAFTGRALYCPMCGGWIVKAHGFFRKITVVDGEVECGRCGAKITFGNQERLDAMTDDAEGETKETVDFGALEHIPVQTVHDTEFEAVQRGRKIQQEEDEKVIELLRKKVIALECALREKIKQLDAVKTCDNCKHRANLTTPSKTGFCLGCYMCGGHNLPDKWEADDGEEEKA